MARRFGRDRPALWRWDHDRRHHALSRPWPCMTRCLRASRPWSIHRAMSAVGWGFGAIASAIRLHLACMMVLRRPDAASITRRAICSRRRVLGQPCCFCDVLHLSPYGSCKALGSFDPLPLSLPLLADACQLPLRYRGSHAYGIVIFCVCAALMPAEHGAICRHGGRRGRRRRRRAGGAAAAAAAAACMFGFDASLAHGI
jgi:hypothetical protein